MPIAPIIQNSKQGTGHRIGILVLFHESEVRLGYRYGRYGLAIGLFWVSSQCRTKRGDHSWHQDVFEFSPCDRYDTECFIYQYVSVSEKKMKVITTELEKKRKE